METLKRRIVLPLLILLMIGCSVKLTRDQQYLWALNIFESQYDMCLDQMISPDIDAETRKMLGENPDRITKDMIRADLSDDQREILVKKLKVLVEVHPLLMTIAAYRDRGEVAPADIQNSVTRMINSLIGEE